MTKFSKGKRHSKQRQQFDRDSSEVMKETDFYKMRRKLRIMENDRRAYSQEVTNVLLKQTREIEILRCENHEMQESLSVAYGKSHLTKDMEYTHKLKMLVEARDDYINLYELESAECKELSVKIDLLRRQLHDYRKRLGGENAVRDKKISTMCHIQRLEKSVNKLTTDFCTRLAENEKLREKINLLILERTIYRSLYDKLADRVSAYKNRIMDVTKDASSHYEQRLEAMGKMKTLRERSVKDEAVFQAEMKVLQRMIAHDTKLKDFMSTKENERFEYKAEEAEKRAKMSFKEKALNEEMQHVLKYEHLFENVKLVTGHEDLEKVVKEFTAKDDENFSRFDYVSELNNDVENMREEIQLIKDNIKRVQAEDEQMKTGCERIIQDLQQQKEVLTHELEQEEGKLALVSDKLDVICASIHLLFKRTGCTTEMFKSTLAYEDKVSPDNIKVYLGLVEQRLLELIGIQQFVSLYQDAHGNFLRQPRSNHRIRPRGPSKILLSVVDKPAMPSIMTPVISDDTISEVLTEEVSVPLDVEELRLKAFRKIAKKEAAGLLNQPLFAKDTRKQKPKNKM